MPLLSNLRVAITYWIWLLSTYLFLGDLKCFHSVFLLLLLLFSIGVKKKKKNPGVIHCPSNENHLGCDYIWWCPALYPKFINLLGTSHCNGQKGLFLLTPTVEAYILLLTRGVSYSSEPSCKRHQSFFCGAGCWSTRVWVIVQTLSPTLKFLRPTFCGIWWGIVYQFPSVIDPLVSNQIYIRFLHFIT